MKVAKIILFVFLCGLASCFASMKDNKENLSSLDVIEILKELEKTECAGMDVLNINIVSVSSVYLVVGKRIGSQVVRGCDFEFKRANGIWGAKLISTWDA